MIIGSIYEITHENVINTQGTCGHISKSQIAMNTLNFESLILNYEMYFYIYLKVSKQAQSQELTHINVDGEFSFNLPLLYMIHGDFKLQ